MIKFLMRLFSRRFYETVADMPRDYWNAYINVRNCKRAGQTWWEK
jgi:hypothetical protein